MYKESHLNEKKVCLGVGGPKEKRKVVRLGAPFIEWGGAREPFREKRRS